MAYTFTQTGAEIQDILDQVPENTSDIASLNETLTQCIALKTYSYQYTIPANGSLTISGNDIGLSIPSGMFPIGIRMFSTGSSNVMPFKVEHTLAGNSFNLRNLSSNAVTATLQVGFMYAKTSMVQTL